MNVKQGNKVCKLAFYPSRFLCAVIVVSSLRITSCVSYFYHRSSGCDAPRTQYHRWQCPSIPQGSHTCLHGPDVTPSVTESELYNNATKTVQKSRLSSIDQHTLGRALSHDTSGEWGRRAGWRASCWRKPRHLVISQNTTDKLQTGKYVFVNKDEIKLVFVKIHSKERIYL